jgi:MFS family permease
MCLHNVAMFARALDRAIVATAASHGPAFWQSTTSPGGDRLSLTGTAVTPLYGKLADILDGALCAHRVGIFVARFGRLRGGASATALILARAFQGLGGGGLMALAQTIIADIVSPRERGRYQGYIGAVFAASSVGSPVRRIPDRARDWSLIFWINLPRLAYGPRHDLDVLRRVPFHARKHSLDDY